jgi:hypothetical protein
MTYELRKWCEAAICCLAVLLLLQSTTLQAGKPNPVGSESASPQAVIEIDPSIRQVSTGGYWREVEESGVYRAVVTAKGNDHLTYFVYVQWLGYDRSTGASVIRTTAPLE